MAPHRPRAVAFDVVETLFALDPVAAALDRVGAGPGALDGFFAGLLRDAFALGATGDARPFRAVADAALGSAHPTLAPDQRAEALDAFASLDPHPDVAPALFRVADAGLPTVALTNGSAQVTTALLERAGLDHLVARVISVDEVGVWKPRPEPYRFAADALDVGPGDLALVAVHAWDVHGAAAAGLRTGWVSREGADFPATFTPPDVQATDLVAAIDALLALPERPPEPVVGPT